DKKPDMAKQSENEKDESLVNTNKSIIKKIVKDISNKTNNSIKTGAVIVPNIKAEIGSETKKEFIFHEPAINENILNLVNKVQKTKLEKPLESENNKMENLKRVGLLAATAIMSIISALMLLSNPKK
ncbi:hypothetical protein, partial [uncultured Clostridium sp.]|uniref:hypothetical protein n=1 Tax=uncultured Clostridium sp. TaxID=59620 RepID=UPI00262EF3BE